MKRLALDLQDQQHQAIKILASMANLSMKEYVIQKAIPKDFSVPNQETLATFAKTDQGKELNEANDEEDLFRQLDI